MIAVVQNTDLARATLRTAAAQAPDYGRLPDMRGPWVFRCGATDIPGRLPDVEVPYITASGEEARHTASLLLPPGIVAYVL